MNKKLIYLIITKASGVAMLLLSVLIILDISTLNKFGEFVFSAIIGLVILLSEVNIDEEQEDKE